MLYACDSRWWKEYAEEVAGFAGERWMLGPTFACQPGVSQIEGADMPGISGNPRRIFTGGNGGYQAIGLAVLWGARRIVLLGYDMQRAGGRAHWHADHNEQRLGNPHDFETWRARLAVAASDLRHLGVEVINASRETALTCFDRVPLEEALKERVNA